MVEQLRITVDSVIEDRVRVLVSKDNKTEEAFIIPKSELQRILKDKKLPRHAEGQVFTIRGKSSKLIKFLKDTSKRGIRAPPVQLDISAIEKITNNTTRERNSIRGIQKALRKRMKGES